MYKGAKGALEQVNEDHVWAARTLGMSELSIFIRIMLPEAWPGILAGLALSFARSLGEFGATLLVAGNIPAAPKPSRWLFTLRPREAICTRRGCGSAS